MLKEATHDQLTDRIDLYVSYGKSEHEFSVVGAVVIDDNSDRFRAEHATCRVD